MHSPKLSKNLISIKYFNFIFLLPKTKLTNDSYVSSACSFNEKQSNAVSNQNVCYACCKYLKTTILMAT